MARPMTLSIMRHNEVDLAAEERRILAAFTRSLVGIAALSRRGADSSNAPSVRALDVLRQPAILLDLDGLVIDSNVAAVALFDLDIRVKERRLFIRDQEARAKLQSLILEMKLGAAELSQVPEPIVIPRRDQLPVLLRIWPIDEAGRWPSHDIRFLLTLNALGPKPGPAPSILAKTFGLTPSEAKLACIIARGAGPEIAAQELKISRETARNQLKSVFAKTGTHRQSELVALLLQVD